jgi:hypothetical protein
MTLYDLDARMQLGVSRSDVADYNGSYVLVLNDAQREICRRRSWSWMKSVLTSTLPAGQTALSLPTTFKELTNARTPVHLVTDGMEYPVDVWTMEKHKRRASSRVGTQVVAHLDDTVSPKTLEFITPFDNDTEFTVQHYAYLSDLTLPTSSNALTVQFPDMLLSLAKARAFFLVNDPVGAEHLASYEQQFRQAAAADGYAQLAGTNLRM